MYEHWDSLKSDARCRFMMVKRLAEPGDVGYTRRLVLAYESGKDPWSSRRQRMGGRWAGCTAGHKVVKQGFDALHPIDDIEEDMLDTAWGLKPKLRLCCQAMVVPLDVVVQIPKYVLNYAKKDVGS